MRRALSSRLVQCVARGVEWLRSESDRIVDSRDAALTISALIAAEKNARSPVVQRLVSRLRASQKSNGSWNDEIWDTAWALKALLAVRSRKDDPAVDRALLFIRNTREAIRGTWYGEPFETIIVLDVLADLSIDLVYELGRDAIDWLLDLQKPSGLVIGPHYTAMFGSLMRRIASPGDKRLAQAAGRAADWLRTDLERVPIWTSAAWSNSYALATLLDAGDSLESLAVAKAVSWFLKNQSRAGSWEHVARLDDTAMAILVLSELLTQPLTLVCEPTMGVVQVHRENGTVRVVFETTTATPVVQSERFKIAEEVRVELTRHQGYLFEAGKRLRSRSVAHVPTDEKQDMAQRLVAMGLYAHGHLVPPLIRDAFEVASVDHLRLDLDERLIDLPWELLHDGDNFVCLRYAVGRRLLSEQRPSRRQIRRAGRLKVLIVADTLGDLEHAAEEGRALNALLASNSAMDVQLRTGRSFKKQDFLLHFNEHDIVHFAGHAEYDARNPDESSILFSDGGTTAFELARFVRDSPPSLVFLNACWSATESAQGDRYPAMIRGLGRTLLYSGVLAFIGYLLPIRDDSAIRMAVHFYQNLIARQTVGESLRRARIALVEELDEEDCGWAAAVLYGDPAGRPLDRERSTWR